MREIEGRSVEELVRKKLVDKFCGGEEMVSDELSSADEVA